MRYIDQFQYIFLDVCRTFMFEVDSFSKEERYDKTYASLGGQYFSKAALNDLLWNWYKTMEADYLNPDCYESFGKSRYYLKKVLNGHSLPEKEMKLIEKVIGIHERGIVPKSHEMTIQNLAKTHQLGIISDIWTDSEYFYEVLNQLNLTPYFERIIFSSDVGAIKPSKKIFEIALENIDLPRSKILYIGDSLKRDIEGSKKVDIASVWISYGRKLEPQNNVVPNRIVEDFTKIFELK